MTTKPLKDSLPDEHILQVEPRPRPSVEAGWRSRPNLYTGRALSAEALSAEQRERSGRLALRGQMVAPGVVAGLEVRLEEEVTATQERLYRFHISPGMGLTASGEDVCLSRPLRVPLRQIAVYRGASGNFDLSVLYGKPDELPATHNNLQAAVLVLVPVVSKKALTTEAAQPVVIAPEDYAFEDQQLVDGCALVLFDWPLEWKEFLPSRDTSSDHEKWRNRLAWEIFHQEQQRQPGQCAPWEEVGVPLALVGFEAPPRENRPTPPLFVDRAAVVRSGGAPRARTPLLESRGSPLLWQARTLQFAEQLASLPSETLMSAGASSAFDRFPPLGTLPKHAIDLFTWRHRFFPDLFILDAVPVPLEQLDAVAHASASLEPLRSWEQERVRVLVPIPDTHFEPRLLQEELLDPAFPKAINAALKRLSHWLQRRTHLRGKAIVLLNTLEGVTQKRYPEPDPAAIPGENEGKDWDPNKGDEEKYETAVSHLEEVYEKWGQNGTWAEPMNMGFSASHVSMAVAQDGNNFGVVTQNDDGVLSGAIFKNKQWSAWANASNAPQPAHEDFRAVWSGSEFTIVTVAREAAGKTPRIHVRIGRFSSSNQPPTEWLTLGWEPATDKPDDQVQVNTECEILAFTAVSAGAGHIDAFVAPRITVTKTTGPITTPPPPPPPPPPDKASKPDDGSINTTLAGGTVAKALDSTLTNEDGTVVNTVRSITTRDDGTGTTQSTTTITGPDGTVLSTTTTLGTTTPHTDGSVVTINESTTKTNGTVTITRDSIITKANGSIIKTKTVSTTTYGILKFTFTWDDGTSSRSVEELTNAKGKLVKKMVALTPPAPKSSQSAVARSLSGARIELLFLGTDDLPSDPSQTSSSFWFHHLQGTHEFGTQAEETHGLVIADIIEMKRITGDHLSACWTMYDKQQEKYQLDALVMGNEGILHGRYIESWRFSDDKLSKTPGNAIVAASRARDDRVHAFWWAREEYKDSQTTSPLMYSWLEGERWSPPVPLLPNVSLTESSQKFSAVINGTSLIDLFLATSNGLHHFKLEADKTIALVNQKGLRRFISDSTELLDRVDEFIHAGSSQVQADTQNVRQLMISGTTEASRLVVSPILGATMVQSPLAARSDIESFLSYFHRKREALLGLASSTPDEIDILQDALETLQQATSTRRDLTERLIRFVEELGLDVSDMALLGIAVYTSDLSNSGIQHTVKIEEKKTVARESILVSELVSNQDTLRMVLARIEQEPDALENTVATHTPPLEWKASDYFSTSVQHLENVLVLLQELEGRMGPHHQAMDDYKKVLVELEQDWAALKKRLEAVEGEIAEARQDVTVARALLTEEESRIAGINQRRRQLFEQHVPFLVFQRPRESELTRETPSRELDPGRVKEFQPEVLASTAAAPSELLAYIELIRDSPLKGFTVTPKLLDGLDRLELIQRTFEWAQARAVQRLPIRLPVLPSNPTSYAQGLFQLLSAREQLITQQRGAFVHFNRSALYTRPLRELKQLAGELLSLGDLIDTAQGRPEVGQGAAAELALISKVATGLYERFGGVLPVIRLEWAERMSQYDAPVNLHDLSRLPRWTELESTERRELQTLVDWLFQRVVSTRPEAFFLMNDLVRTCMLLASHVPVNELLSGEVSKTTVARVGGNLELKVTQMRVRIGMHVVVRSAEQTVQAVVVDLSSGLVRTRVLSTSAATVQLPEKTPAFFSEPARGTGALLPYVGARR